MTYRKQANTRVRQALFFSLFILSLSVTGCRKEDRYHELIQGTWVGQTKIRKSTTTINGSIASESADTTVWTASGYQLQLTFRGDLADLYIKSPSLIQSGTGGRFTLDGSSLRITGNPFSFKSSNSPYGPAYPNLPPSKLDYCQVLELTKDKLVLYDKDTIAWNPLIIHQQWNSFAKK